MTEEKFQRAKNLREKIDQYQKRITYLQKRLEENKNGAGSISLLSETYYGREAKVIMETALAFDKQALRNMEHTYSIL